MKKAKDHLLHSFTDLNDMTVGVIKADHALTPSMLFQRVNIFQIRPHSKALQKGIQIRFFKIQLRGTIFKCDLIFRKL